MSDLQPDTTPALVGSDSHQSEERPVRRVWRRSRRILTHPAVIVAALLFWLSAWAIASPVGAEPDADFHSTTLWCQTADASSRCPTGYLLDGTKVVQTYRIFDLPCFAHDPGTTPECQTDNFETFYTYRINKQDYPSGYYLVMGTLASSRVVLSTIGIRIANALIFVVLMGLIYWLARPPVRNAMLGALALGLVPVGVFFIASINPSSWAITGVAAQLFALLAISGQSSRAKALALAGLSIVGVALAASARGDAAVYTVGVSIIAGWLIFPTLKSQRWLLLPMAVPVATAVASVSVARQVTGGVAGSTPKDPAVYNFFNILELPIGNLGVGEGFGGLGWLDTPMPALTWVVTTLALGVMLLGGLQGASWCRGLAAGGVAFALVAIPYYLLQSAGLQVPQFVQPRYVLPLLLVLLGVVCWRDPAERLPRKPVPNLAVLAALAVAHSAALYANLLRYTNGMRPYLLGSEISWWWSFPIPPQLVWTVGSLGFAVAVLALGLARGSADEQSPVEVLR